MPLNIPRTISSSANSAVTVEKNSGWQPIPHINQLHPDGANSGYVNGEKFCGPAVVAMLARGANRAPSMSDARLIQELGNGLVSKEGSTPEDLVRMLERVHLPLGGDALPSSYTDAAVQDHLRQGHKLMVQVAKVDPKTHEVSAHYILVRGMTADGHYKISDPLAKEPHAISPKRLHELVSQAPPYGGVLIPVAAPRHVSEGSTPDKVKQAYQDKPGKTHELPGIMARRQEHYDFELKVDYITQKLQTTGFTQPVSPDDRSADDFAKHLLWLMRNGKSEKVLALVAQLQSSPFPRDQRVVDHVMYAAKHQPGVGKKLQGDPCIG